MKGQIFLTDLIFVISIFILVLGASITVWSQLGLRLHESKVRREMESLASSISDLLVKQPGVPEKWEENAVETDVLGLAYDGIFNLNKIKNFTSLDYSQTKKLLGLGNYNFYFKVSYSDKTEVSFSGIYPSDFRYLVLARRFGLLDKQAVVMELLLWD